MEIESPTVNECLLRASEISDHLNNTGYVILRSANWSIEEADFFMVEFANLHGWRVTMNDPSSPHWVYVEDHKHSLAFHEQIPSSEEIFIHWHAEQTNLEFPQHGALWQMLHKSSSPSSGQTGFIDNAELFRRLNDSDREFLIRCEAVMTPTIARYDPLDLISKIRINERNDRFIPFKSYGDIHINFVRPLVQIQERTGLPCIRFNSHYEEWEVRGELMSGVMSKMILIDGRAPTKSEENRAEKLMVSIARQIYADRSLHTWIEWQEGDIIISDLFRMTHAVRGGFSAGERVFRGIWAFDRLADVPRDPKQIDAYSKMADEIYFTAEY